MKVLFTGASSFTGMHFVEALLERGFSLTCTFTRDSLKAYEEPLARARIERVIPNVVPVWGTIFGGYRWQELLHRENFDLLCHHAAEVSDYKSKDFDVHDAVKKNCYHLQETLINFKKNGGQAVILTGTYFERDEGCGTKPILSFSPYGESKALTAETFRESCEKLATPLGKYVCPNPFGPLEKPNFTSSLARNWLYRRIPQVRRPDTIRDNIAVTTLAADYADFVAAVLEKMEPFRKRNPSGWVESNLQFARRVAAELRPRLNMPCEISVAPESKGKHPDSEPPERYNTEPLQPPGPTFWDDLARFYLRFFK